MQCWYCHWGWAAPVVEIYNRALKKLDGDSSPLHYGPAHIVWDDENFDCAEDCLRRFDENAGDLSDFEKEVVRVSLQELAALPREEWDVEPEDYDGQHPEKYPPKKPTLSPGKYQ